MIIFFQWLCAVTPIILLFVLIGFFHVSTQKSAVIGAIAAAIVSLTILGASPHLVIFESIKGAWNSLSILFAIWPAVFFYEIMHRTGIFPAIRSIVTKYSQDELLIILLFAWLLSSFLQGISGFGVPVAVCAPILIRLGVKPLWSIVITLAGHAWANTFGTLGLAWSALVQQTGNDSTAGAMLLTGILLWICNFAGGAAICLFYGRLKALYHMLPLLLATSLVQGGGQLLMIPYNATVAAFLPTTLAPMIVILYLRLGLYKSSWRMDSPIMQRNASTAGETTGHIRPAWIMLPFFCLAIISVILLLIPPVYNCLSEVALSIPVPETRTLRGVVNAAQDSFGTLRILTHAGTVLFLTSIFSWCLYRRLHLLKSNDLRPVMQATAKKMMPVSAGIIGLLVCAQLLRGSGAIEIIARGATAVFGKAYGFAAPFVGVLGSFVTSSNTSSNILLGSFQLAAAEMISVPPSIILAAQTAGGAIGTVFGPSTILLGASTAGCVGDESSILKRMIPFAFTLAVTVGIITLLLTGV